MVDSSTDDIGKHTMQCPECQKLIIGKFWGGNDWRFGCNHCGYVVVLPIINNQGSIND